MNPGTGTSVVLIALGAILTFAVEVTVAGFDIAAAGVILMIVGAIGLVASLVWYDDGFGRRTVTRTTVERPLEPTTVVREHADGVVVRERPAQVVETRTVRRT